MGFFCKVLIFLSDPLLNEALTIIDKKGFKEGRVQYVENNKFLPNTIISQSPNEGTKVSQGSKINLVVVK